MNQESKWVKLGHRYIDVDAIYEIKLIQVPSVSFTSNFTTYTPAIVLMLPNSMIEFEPDEYHTWIKKNNLNLPIFEDKL